MSPQQLTSIIKNPAEITAEQSTKLKTVLDQYPYFQLGFTVLAKVLYDQNPESAQQAIAVAAIYATSRAHLKVTLESKWNPKLSSMVLDAMPLSLPYSFPQILAGKDEENCSSPRQSEEKRMAKKLEKIHIVENFIKKSTQTRHIMNNEVSLEDPTVDLTKESTILHDKLFTRSLARIMLQQGKTEWVADICKRLKIKFPEGDVNYSNILEEKKDR